MVAMFNGCNSLTSVPLFDTSSVTNFANMFANCNSLARIEAKDFNFTFSVASCKLSAAALDEIYTNLPTVTGQTITVTGNYGIAGDDPTIATAKGWTVTGS
jgi:surface protein